MPYALWLLLLAATSLSAQADLLPTYQDIVYYYFTHYRSPDGPYQLRFSRRPDGYHAERMLHLTTIDTSELLYDFDAQSYRPLSDAFPASEADSLAADDFLSASRYAYEEMRRVPYYGYNGWYKDVIDLYENAATASMSTWELQALARTYQFQAAAKLGMHSGFVDPADPFDLPPTRGGLSEAQIEAYLELVEKELAAYREIMRREPTFVTPVGPVTTKYWNEVMDAFLSLLYNQDEAAARRVLRPELYDPYFLQMGRNWLRSCPPDAVLFTYGDSDTYPLYYLQATEGLRTDVILVNLSLAILPRYQQMVYAGPFGARPLRTLLSPRFFEKIVVGYTDTYPEEEKTLAVSALFSVLADSSSYQANEVFPDQYRVTIPATTFRLTTPSDVADHEGKRVDHVVLSTFAGHLLPDHMLFFDLLQANDWQRPLCFAPTVHWQQYPGPTPYLVWEGMILRFYPRFYAEATTPEPITDANQFTVLTERSYRYWMETYTSDTSATITDFDKLPYHQAAHHAGLRLVQDLAKRGDKARAQALAQRLIQLFPDRQYPWGNLWVYLAKALADIGDITTAEYIAYKVLDNFQAQRLSDVELEYEEMTRGLICEMAEQKRMKKLLRRCN